MTDLFDHDDDQEPKGPDYERLAHLARVTRPQAPPDFVDRVMRAIRLSDAPVERRSRLDPLRRFLHPGLRPRPAVLGVLAVAALVLVIASLVTRPGPRPGADGSPEMIVHRFEFVAPHAREVCLVGDFNAWELCRVPLVKDERTGAWSVEVPLPPGRHEYMFVVDEQRWVTDPAAPVQVDDGFGNQNAVVFL